MTNIEYTVDDVPFKTDKEFLTPLEILTRASFDPKRFYLILIEHDHEISYKDKDNERIKMHDHMKFITAKIGPTPVSQ